MYIKVFKSTQKYLVFYYWPFSFAQNPNEIIKNYISTDAFELHIVKCSNLVGIRREYETFLMLDFYKEMLLVSFSSQKSGKKQEKTIIHRTYTTTLECSTVLTITCTFVFSFLMKNIHPIDTDTASCIVVLELVNVYQIWILSDTPPPHQKKHPKGCVKAHSWHSKGLV